MLKIKILKMINKLCYNLFISVVENYNYIEMRVNAIIIKIVLKVQTVALSIIILNIDLTSPATQSASLRTFAHVSSTHLLYIIN